MAQLGYCANRAHYDSFRTMRCYNRSGEHLGKRSHAFRHDGVVTRKAGACLHDDPGRSRMVIAPGQQRRSGRRAKSSGMKLGVAKAFPRQPIHRRRRNRPAERAARAEANIVGYDQENVRCSCRRRHLLWEVLDGVLCDAANVALERLLGSRQHVLGLRR
jgi:hypothetical protein